MIRVSEEAETPGVFDSFRSVELALEISGELVTREIKLPHPDVKVFFHNCRHPWVEQLGCVAGSTAVGQIRYRKVDSQSNILFLDLELSREQDVEIIQKPRNLDGNATIRFSTRIPVGKPLDPKIK